MPLHAQARCQIRFSSTKQKIFFSLSTKLLQLLVLFTHQFRFQIELCFARTGTLEPILLGLFFCCHSSPSLVRVKVYRIGGMRFR